MNRLLLIVAPIIAGTFGGEALSQTSGPLPQDLPPHLSLVDSNGVDLISGTLATEIAGPSVGAKDAGGLGISYNVYRPNYGQSNNSFSGYVSDDGVNAVVSIGGTSDSFDIVSGVGYVSTHRGGSTLVRTGYSQNNATYIYTSADGTIFNLDWGSISRIVYPTGEVISFNTDSGGVLKSISSNTGYQIHFDYSPKKSTAINSAVDYCGLLDTNCNSLTKAWPSLTLNEVSVPWGAWFINGKLVDSLGRSTTYSNSGTACPFATNNNMPYPTVVTINSPTGGVRTITRFAQTSFNPSPQLIYCMTTSDGTWTYKRSPYGSSGTVITNPLGKIRTLSFVAGGALGSDTDENGRTTIYDYDTFQRMTRITYPEGNYVQYTYDGRGNVTETRRVAKAGSNLPDIVTTSTYDPTCSQPVKCNKPNIMIDARGGTTNLSYSTIHGQVLSYVGPADANGIRPTVAYSYAQIATFAKNASGNLTQVGAVWRNTGQMTCRSSAATLVTTATSASLTCAAGAADLVSTLVSYNGSNNAQPTATTSSPGDGSPARTTTVSYDYAGNILSQTSPRGN